MNILITGGAGFIGSTFVEQCLERGYDVTVLDALTYAGHIENLEHIQKNYEFIEGNICDRRIVDKILNEKKIDSVVNFAAESHVDNSIASADIFIQTNINGTYTLLEESRRYQSKLKGEKKENFRYIQISTDEVYGELELKEDRKFNENSNYNPSSPYSSSKAAGDHMTLAWHRTYGLPTIVTNCSNNYGPRQFPEKLIPYMISCALSGENMPIYGDGENIRDWIHVSDHCNGVHLALTKGTVGQTYCFGGNAEKSNIDLVTKLCHVLDDLAPKPRGSYEEQIKFVKDRAGHDRRYAIDDSKAVNELEFTRKYEFEDGLKETVQWYLRNTKWQAQVIRKKLA
ncbi:MAG: dTDP-glucose 4,6-dehydratase [Alphaproteobacteria bacterium CG11_big_fil_rev_8_21_14_0_20_39_49]|nr:MAG: dTDP-glucose 4,6-dehydratase [Alphaproteobacteria bacterium CG11_big_fil_rev_8_21_14_0_20_39_49]